jgi:hypothetical protein
LDISLEDAILHLSPELKVLVRIKRSTANYGKVDVVVVAHGDTECSGDGGQENDDETEHPKDDDGISTDSEDEDCDEVQKSDTSEQLCATTMLAFAVPKQPSTDRMEIFTQRMEEMQRSLTQQLQDLAGQLHPEKKKKTQQIIASSHGCFEQAHRWYLFGKPPAAPLDPVGDFSSSRKVQRTTRWVTKVKFNGSLTNYKDGAKRQRKPSRVELEMEEATAINGPNVLAKLKTLGFAIIKDYDAVRVDDTYVYESLFADENRPTPEQALFYNNTYTTPGGVPSVKKPQLETIFEGVRINAIDWSFKGVASPIDESFGKQQRMLMKNALSGHKPTMPSTMDKWKT